MRIEITPISSLQDSPVTKVYVVIKNHDNNSVVFSSNELFDSNDSLESDIYKLKEMVENPRKTSSETTTNDSIKTEK